MEAGRVVFPISRLICDVERFPSDEDEPMASLGMGVIYTRTSTRGALRLPPNPEQRQSILDGWYWPHHRKLQLLVGEVAARLGRCLIIDCHSFPSVPLAYELSQDKTRAEICIGTDEFHTPPQLRHAVVSTAKQAGYSVAVDVPFAGALVPLAFYRKDRRILSLMIEINRRLYMEEHSGQRTIGFDKVREAIRRLIVEAVEAAIEIPVAG